METVRLDGCRPPDTWAGLACERCRRRKIKCDRAFPTCRRCLKISGNCSYPTTSKKPGPKPGAPQKTRRARAGYAPPTQNVSTATPQLPSDEVQPSPREDQGITMSSNRGPIPKARIPQSPSRSLPLSQLVHPSHEPVQNSSIDPSNNTNIRLNNDSLLSDVLKSLHISEDVYQYLLHSYFENMTAFSLFHRPSFEKKIQAITSRLQLQALVAAMFSFSSRFNETSSEAFVATQVPSHLHFRKVACQSVEDALKDCSDDAPPLCLLQAFVLITFDELIRGVRGRAWRLVGECISIAYELQLHLIDKDLQNTSSHSDQIDPLIEEKRRTWWAIWEFDVFASTIRRLPTAIDWTVNATYLPVDDDAWFANAYTASCHLHPDASLAWKSLQKSDNRNPKAWFIVVNALMRSAHALSYPQAYPNAIRSQQPAAAENLQGTLNIISNSLYCLSAALPQGITYHGEYLAFSNTSEGLKSLQLDSARYSIQIMIQLSRFMINHYQVFDSTSRQLSLVNSSSQISRSSPAINLSAWNHYLAAASEIVTLVRSCSPRHVSYVNPFLSSTIWLAAAAQIVSKHLGQPLIDPRVADSNLDLLQANLNAFVSIWGVSSALQQKLITLETRLDSFGEQVFHTGQRDSRGEQAAESMSRATGSGMGTYQSNEMRRNGSNANAPTGISQQHDAPISDWSFEPGLDATGPEFGSVLGLDLWGWGIDELLNYNGMNELSTY